MMFLKTTPFTYQGEQVTLYELSALQRTEYFEFLATQATDTPTEMDGITHTAAMILLNTETAAWLVSRSQWHAQREQAVDSLYLEVLASWPDNALALAIFQRRLQDVSLALSLCHQRLELLRQPAAPGALSQPPGWRINLIEESCDEDCRRVTAMVTLPTGERISLNEWVYQNPAGIHNRYVIACVPGKSR